MVTTTGNVVIDLLHNFHLECGARAVRVADGIGAPLGDPREQCLGSKRPAHARAGSEAVARYAAHVRSPFAPLAPSENRSRTFVRKVYGSWPVNPRLWARIVPNEKCLMRGTRRADVACVETNAAEPLFDAQSEAFEEAESAGAVQDPLKLYVRAIGDGRRRSASSHV